MPTWTSVKFDPKSGYPAGSDLYLECAACGSRIPSAPADSAQCGCGNVRIDVDAGRVSVTDERKMRLVRRS